ncbi:MAG: hypothetical protein ABJZ69_06555 [Hyphomicrobiales bacterium]
MRRNLRDGFYNSPREQEAIEIYVTSIVLEAQNARKAVEDIHHIAPRCSPEHATACSGIHNLMSEKGHNPRLLKQEC